MRRKKVFLIAVLFFFLLRPMTQLCLAETVVDDGPLSVSEKSQASSEPESVFDLTLEELL